jgi:hypothetical protein
MHSDPLWYAQREGLICLYNTWSALCLINTAPCGQVHGLLWLYLQAINSNRTLLKAAHYNAFLIRHKRASRPACYKIK